MKRNTFTILLIVSLLFTGVQFLAAQNTPTETKNLETFKRFFEEGWNKQNEAIADETIAPGCMFYVNGELVQAAGPEAQKEFIKRNASTFPGFTMTILDIFAKDDKLVARYKFEGVHSQLKKPVILYASFIVQFKDGKMIKTWTHDNQWSIFKQLGFQLAPPKGVKFAPQQTEGEPAPEPEKKQ